MVASLTERIEDAHPDLSAFKHTANRQVCVCVCVREEEWGVGVALGVLMTQFPPRAGPPICERNRRDRAKKKRVNEGNYMGQGGDIRAREQMVN